MDSDDEDSDDEDSDIISIKKTPRYINIDCREKLSAFQKCITLIISILTDTHKG